MVTEKLKKLCTPAGIAGREYEAVSAFKALILPFCTGQKHDSLGNFYAYRKACKTGAKTIMLEAHADKTGLIVRHISSDGFVIFSEIGGFDPKVLPATNVIIHGREKVFGVIDILPVHVKPNKDDKVTPASDLFIDTGYSYQALIQKISVGDLIEIDTTFTPLLGDIVAAGACDDRAGLLVIAECLRLLKDEDLTVDICAAATVQEEVGCRGAVAAAENIRPHMAVCIDVCHGKTPDADDNTFELGGGPVITVGPNIQRPMSKALITCARENSIPHKIDVDPGNTGTNAWVVQVSGMGVYTGLISIPVRYMHTPYEVINTKDIENSARLLASFIKELRGDEICY
jgi:putative aminopeptidase FrvX